MWIAKDSRSDIAFVLSNRRSIGLDPEYRYSLDIADFLRDLDQGRFEEAAALYRGDFLADFYLGDSSEFEAWATSWRSNLRRQALSALNTLTESRLAQGAHIQAEQYARQQLLIDDLREGPFLQWMQGEPFETDAALGSVLSSMLYWMLNRMALMKHSGMHG